MGIMRKTRAAIYIDRAICFFVYLFVRMRVHVYVRKSNQLKVGCVAGGDSTTSFIYSIVLLQSLY